MAEAEEPKKQVLESEKPSDLPPAPATATTSSEEKPAVVEAPKEEYKEKSEEKAPEPKDESKALAIAEKGERERERTKEKERNAGLRSIIDFVVHALGVAALVLVLVWSIYFRGGFAWEATDKRLIFNLHPFLMVLGLVFFGGEAIISYRSLPLRKDVKKLVHLVLHAIALALGIIGIYTAFKNHNETGVANLYSLHSWIGIGVICLYGIQWIYGFLVLFYPKGSPGLRSDSVPWHVLFGLLVYILVVGNATLGFLEKLTFLESSGVEKFGSEAFLVNFTALVTLVFGAFVIFSVISQGPVEEDHSYSEI